MLSQAVHASWLQPHSALKPIVSGLGKVQTAIADEEHNMKPVWPTAAGQTVFKLALLEPVYSSRASPHQKPVMASTLLHPPNCMTAGADADNKMELHPSAEAMAAAEHADAAREIAPAQQVTAISTA